MAIRFELAEDSSWHDRREWLDLRGNHECDWSNTELILVRAYSPIAAPMDVFLQCKAQSRSNKRIGLDLLQKL